MSKSMEESYIGSLISIISNYDIRYEGVISHLSINDSTISLKNVKIYGTEGRRKDGPQVPPHDRVFDLVLFRGSDIKVQQSASLSLHSYILVLDKESVTLMRRLTSAVDGFNISRLVVYRDLRIKSLWTSTLEEQMHNDPALIQSQCAGVPSSPSVPDGDKFVMTPALMSRTSPMGLPSYSGHSPDFINSFQANSISSFSLPLPWQSYGGNVSNRSHALLQTTSTSSSHAVQNQKASGLHFSPVWGLVDESESTTPIPPASSLLSHNLLPTETPFTFPTSVDMPASSSVKSPILTHAAHINNQPVSPLTPLPHQGMHTTEVQPMPSPAISRIGFSHLPPPHPSLLSLDKQAWLKPPVISSTQKVDTDGNYNGFLPHPSSALTPLIPTPTSQAPFLPLSKPLVISSTQKVDTDGNYIGILPYPSSASPPFISTPAFHAPVLLLPNIQPQDNYSTTHFTEEFDFEAMNEKFKKDEVWNDLKIQMQRASLSNLEENATGQLLEPENDTSPEWNVDPENLFLLQSAYKKDDFFDTISRDSLAHCRNGKSRFAEQIKLDTQAFGNPRHNPCHGGFDAGHGRHHHVSHDRGRG